jgi:hypothetical protein
MRASPELERFIRQTLGCGCPDAVFASVTVRRGPLTDTAADPAWWIGVGGRLLIAVCHHTAGLEPSLDAAVSAGRARRDRDGFNRFRLVIAGTPSAAAESLKQRFARHADADDRLHLHLVAPSELPPLVTTESEPA